MVAFTLGLAVIAHAAISSIQPSSEQGEPGETVSAIVSVTTSGLLPSCVTATSDSAFVITFNDDLTACGTGTWSALMEVVIPAVTPPGNYTVTVSEVVGSSLLGTHAWPLQVTAPATTTTLLPEVTLFPTTTTIAPTTTTSAPTTTTSAATTTTSAAAATTVTPNGTATSSSSTSLPGNVTRSSQAQGLTYTPPAIAPPIAGETDNGPANTPTTGEDSSSDAEARFSEIAVSTGLIEVADRALPPVFAQAVLSPLVILEVLLRALGRTGSGLLIPLAVTILAGLGLARRLRRDVGGLAELDEFGEIPDEEEGR